MKLKDLLEDDKRIINQIGKESNISTLIQYISDYNNSSVDVKAKLFARLLKLLSGGYVNNVYYIPVLRNLEANDYLTEPVVIRSMYYCSPGTEDEYLQWLLDVEQDINVQFVTDNIKLAAVKLHGANIEYITNPTTEQLTTALTEKQFVKWDFVYDKFVKIYFKDNTLLMNKWLRYAKGIREAHK